MLLCDRLHFSIDQAYSRRSAITEMAGKKGSEVNWSGLFFLHPPHCATLYYLKAWNVLINIGRPPPGFLRADSFGPGVTVVHQVLK